jgi:hypothetical protein
MIKSDFLEQLEEMMQTVVAMESVFARANERQTLRRFLQIAGSALEGAIAEVAHIEAADQIKGTN